MYYEAIYSVCVSDLCAYYALNQYYMQKEKMAKQNLLKKKNPMK